MTTLPRPCLDCGTLVVGDSRCPRHRRVRDRAFSRAGRERRGPRWGAFSSALRASWSLQGRTCVDSADGRCAGRLQVDHVIPGSVAGDSLPAATSITIERETIMAPKFKDSHDSSSPDSDTPKTVAVDPAAQINLSPTVTKTLRRPGRCRPGEQQRRDDRRGNRSLRRQRCPARQLEPRRHGRPVASGSDRDSRRQPRPGDSRDPGIEAPGRTDVEPNDRDQ